MKFSNKDYNFIETERIRRVIEQVVKGHFTEQKEDFRKNFMLLLLQLTLISFFGIKHKEIFLK